MGRGFLAVCLVAALTGCATAKLHVIQPVNPPSHEVTLSVKSSTPVVSDEQLSTFRTLLTTKLAEEGVSVVPAAGPSTCAVEGTVDRYERGSRALRYFIGFGAGAGKFDSSWQVKDASGNEIGQCRIDGSVSFGAFGGNYEDVLDRVGSRLAGCLLNDPDR